MSETEQADRVLKVIADSMEQGKEFVMEQAPDVVQQFIAWKRVELSLLVCIGALVFVVGLIVAYRALKRVATDKEIDWDEPNPPNLWIVLQAVVGAIACILVGPLMFFVNLFPMLQVWIAPKVFLLEYVAHLAT